MSKTKSSFFCQQCGHESVKWIGQCPGCGAWNSFVEELVQKDKSKDFIDWKELGGDKRAGRTTTLDAVKSSEEKRIITSDTELNRVLGGGIVPGSFNAPDAVPGTAL